MDTAIYYTLSTIAQTLASGLAVLLAIVLFRFAALDEAIRRAQNLMVLELALPADTAWPLLRDSGPAGVNAWIVGHGGNTLRDTPRWATLAMAHEAWGVRVHLTRALRPLLITSAVTIALCFAGLPVTPLLVKTCVSATLALGLSSGLGLVSLVLFGRLIVAIIDRRY